MIVLATVATVIASQALISGAFSLTRQGIALGYFPRMQVIYTSAEVEGQVYLPGVNWLLFAGCAVLVLFFRTSSAMGGAYGVAVTGTMAITTLAFYTVARRWGWSRWWLVPLCGTLLLVDLLLFGSACSKFLDGGFVPLTFGLALFLTMFNWRWGRGVLAKAYAAFVPVPLKKFVELKQALMDDPSLRVQYGRRKVAQVERAIVFLTSRPIQTLDDPCPVGLTIYLKRNGAIPKHVLLLNVSQLHQPAVGPAERCQVTPLGANTVAINARYGYTETPDVPALLSTLKQTGQIKINAKRWTIQIGEEELLIDRRASALRHLSVRLFRFLQRFTNSADRYFGMREYAGRSKTVIPVWIHPTGARIFVADDEDQ
jgi:KUP system potassium uptake protein